MKSFSSIFLLVICFYFSSCTNHKNYDAAIRELDSLKVVVHQSVVNFKMVDSITCANVYEKQYTYLRFLETHAKDTVSKSVAMSLQNLKSTEKGIADYLAYRTGWLYQAAMSVTQLQNLSNDLRNGSVEEKEAKTFIANEKLQAKTVIDQLNLNTQSVRKQLEITSQALPETENYIKHINSGVLPQLIKPNNN